MALRLPGGEQVYPFYRYVSLLVVALRLPGGAQVVIDGGACGERGRERGLGLRVEGCTKVRRTREGAKFIRRRMCFSFFFLQLQCQCRRCVTLKLVGHTLNTDTEAHGWRHAHGQNTSVAMTRNPKPEILDPQP